MTPSQEKARDLVRKYFEFYPDMPKKVAKQCAIICCEEVIKVGTISFGGIQKVKIESEVAKHYKEVIEEINKL